MLRQQDLSEAELVLFFLTDFWIEEGIKRYARNQVFQPVAFPYGLSLHASANEPPPEAGNFSTNDASLPVYLLTRNHADRFQVLVLLPDFLSGPVACVASRPEVSR
jgi:hypothetical protein